MIVDTSALIAVLFAEEGAEPLIGALAAETGVIPAPVLVEFHRVAARVHNVRDPDADALITHILSGAITIDAFDAAAAEHAVLANAEYGRGNGRGGMLNILDLMVYGMAKARGEPILCTGMDFAATDADLHPASRRW